MRTINQHSIKNMDWVIMNERLLLLLDTVPHLLCEKICANL